MEEYRQNTKNPQRPIEQLRDVLTVGLRHRRLSALVFAGFFSGALIVATVSPPDYQAKTTILVKHERMDPIVSADDVNRVAQPDESVTETEMNSEVQLIKSADLLENVVKTCGLVNLVPRPWLRLSSRPEDPNQVTAKAVKTLTDHLKVEMLPKTNLISITYEDVDAQRSAQVLKTVVNLYLEKHMSVQSPAGAFKFFARQAEQYKQGLKTAESRIVEFAQQDGAVSPAEQKTAALEKLSDFEAQLKQTRASIEETKQRISTLEKQAANLQPRMTTQVQTSDNPQLMEQMKSTLLNLELKRTELLQKFEPSYRLVQEVDTQIAQTKAAIESAQKDKLLEETTDSNPIYEWVDSEQAKARSQLAAEEARADALDQSVRAYQAQATTLGEKEVVQEGLLRDQKAEEGNYLLYLRKQEEARISDALDRSRIANLAVTEDVQVPSQPMRSRWFTVLIGLIAAIVMSLGAAITAEYLDPALRTSEDIKEFLDVPVLASVSDRGH